MLGLVNSIFATHQGYDQSLGQVLLDVRAGNSDLAKSLSEKSNHAIYQEEKPQRDLLSLQNYQNRPFSPNFSDLNTRN